MNGGCEKRDKMKRRKTRTVRIGGVRIGGNNPVAIQSMTKVRTSCVGKVAAQLRLLEKEGCEIIRLSVKDAEDALALRRIKRLTKMPVVADIHFDWRLALEAIRSGVDKIRINPGNISDRKNLAQVAAAALSAGVAVRLGINSGSLPAGKGDTVSRMVRGALHYLRILEDEGLSRMVVSLKASSAGETVDAYTRMSSLCDYPLHLGVTATGLPEHGLVKSSVAIGALLLNGIGDTMRVSLTDTPQQEVRAAKLILEAAGARTFGHEVISCPTCGRCEVDLAGTVRGLGRAISGMPVHRGRHLKIAVMGCVVNGPGEASAADIGIAFGKNEGLLFKSGKPCGKVKYENCLPALLSEIRKMSG